MKKNISLLAVGYATSALLAISYTLCIIFDLIFPDYAMYRSWQVILPGFEWLSWKSFFIGLVETYIYGWYFALIWVPIYNFVTGSRDKHECCHHNDSHPAH